MEATQAPLEIVGRDRELARLTEFVASGSPPALVLVGAAGVGKTTLWEACVAASSDDGLRVLSARPSGVEAELSYAGLSDLLDDVEVAALHTVPAPQRRALEIALLRAEPKEAPPEAFAISAGLLNTLRALAEEEPLLVAIDDVQALDRPSAQALAFAARRLGGRPVRFLLASRGDGPSELERSLLPLGLALLEVGPLSLGAARALLSQRVDLDVSRPVLRRIVDTAEGNPLFILELGRLVAERGLSAADSGLPVPDVVDELFGARLAAASRRSRRTLLAVALAGSVTRSELEKLASEAAVEEELRAGSLAVEGARIRVSHPLLAAAARSHSTSRERRALHGELARALDDDARRARHLALATAGPDPVLASRVAVVAERELARGAPEDAAVLAEEALRLTPPESPEHDERLLRLAELLDLTGDQSRIDALLEDRADSFADARNRARAHLLLAVSARRSDEDHLDRAFAETADDPALRATVQEKRAILVSGVHAERFHESEAWLRAALPSARRGGPDVERLVTHTLAWIRMLRGKSVEELLGRLEELVQGPLDRSGVDHLVAQHLAFRGEVNAARRMFRELLALADERGEARFLRLHFQLCGLELRAGDTEAAAHFLAESSEWLGAADADAGRARFEALLVAIRGLPEDTERWAARAIEGSDTSGYVWARLEALRALGIAALLSGDAARAAESLREVRDHCVREGIDNPGVFAVAPDLVEALVELGELDEALAVTSRLQTLGERQHHPWALASARRSRALVELARRYDEEAAAGLRAAAGEYRRLGLRFDEGRTLLALGRGQRRLRRWGLARSSLEQATTVFDEIGGSGWAEQARAELARVGARRPASDGRLTSSEERVARLAAEGLSNKEIAQALFVSVYTVEKHLSRAYAKLGIHSRAQLARGGF